MIPLDSMNPWWTGRESRIIRNWRRMERKWVPSWIDEISLRPFSLNFVIGPRQVGKTTGLHLLAEKLIKSGVNPLSILYLDLDLIWDLDTLKRAFDEYFELRKVEGLDRCFIILDEVTSLEGWWRLVKGYVDLGFFERDILILTGSSSLTLRGEAELFPGRTGHGRTLEVLPLSFREFLKVMGVNVRRTGDLKSDIARLLPLKNRVKELFELYMELGGFPLSINEDQVAGESLIRSLIGELIRLKRSPSLAMGIMSSVIRKSPSPMSYSSVGNDVGVSYKTARDYLEVLKGLMIIGEAPLLKEGKVSWRKERKYFFRDPFLSEVISDWTGAQPIRGAVHEWIVQEHVYRRFGKVYYTRNGLEIDVVANGLKVEVKAGKPHRRYPRDVIVLDEEDFPSFLAVVV